MVLRPYAANFRVVGSTAATDAQDNIDLQPTATGVPIYWFTGERLADGYADFGASLQPTAGKALPSGAMAPTGKVRLSREPRARPRSQRLTVALLVQGLSSN